jgi:hypothetical protein
MDLKAMPEEIVAMYDNASVSDGVAVFKPDAAAARSAPSVPAAE